ncbi:hypothetical protein [Parabacteroides sp. FAFU027]|uniref:hypothetical protein n=1 Tax=Parabacteroides sp. FAFU027 TaxID=2922715 RepID=UPI001FAF8057|nr:hypothetical protein [Parabacteroides sp. FAFU027]
METESLAPEEKIVFYELEKVRFIMKDATGLDIGYAYEDLVFSEHGIFIIQFDGTDADKLLVFFNHECVEAKHQLFLSRLVESGKLNGMKMVYKGKFEMSQVEGEENIQLRFF